MLCSYYGLSLVVSLNVYLLCILSGSLSGGIRVKNRLIEASSLHRGGGDYPKRNSIEVSSLHRGGGDSPKRNSIEASSLHRGVVIP